MGSNNLNNTNTVNAQTGNHNYSLQQEFVTLKDNPFNGVIARPDIKRKKTLTESEIKKYIYYSKREKKRKVWG